MSQIEIETNEHREVCAWFFGPKGENLDILNRLITALTTDSANGRQDYFPLDPSFIDAAKGSESFEKAQDKLENILGLLSIFMRKHCVPFYSPRYMGHMSNEATLPSVIGYILGLMYNQNNVAVEASPLTTLLEWEVGQQLCAMLGFQRHPPLIKVPYSGLPKVDNKVYGWGHITCDGSVANLESMWVARNLKYYPLCLKSAMTLPPPSDPNASPPLDFAYGTFEISVLSPGKGEVKKLFKDCTTWELLNLRADTVLSLPSMITTQFGTSPNYVENAMGDYDVQSLGKRCIEDFYEMKEPHGFTARTRHYSWPKGAAILGIGKNNLVSVPVDLDARLDIDELRKCLEKCYKERRAVYNVVAIIGSTEHGAVDPLAKVLSLRQEFERTHGMTFLVHADAAWGGYFASMKRLPPLQRSTDADMYVGKVPLSDYTNEHVVALGWADSVTIDPHKSGYIPYPAGGLCYRDERMRYLVTWTSPYLDGKQEGVESIGVYGVEGSKPGAAAVATFLAHEVIGLTGDQNVQSGPAGYQILLGEAIWTATRMYCQWVLMDTGNDGFNVTLLQRLPAEKTGTPEEVAKQKEEIRTFLDVPNVAITEETHPLFFKLGSDLMINTFACNFRIGDELNTNVAEANYLNQRIYARLSMLRVQDKLEDKPIVIMGTSFAQKDYGECMTNLKRRMGLDPADATDLYGLCNVYMSPFPTTYQFIDVLADEFQTIAQEISQDCRWRNIISADRHTFLLQNADEDPTFLVYLPMFQAENAREHVIISVALPSAVRATLTATPAKFFTFTTTESMTLAAILGSATFEADVYRGYPSPDGRTPPLVVGCAVRIRSTVLRYSLRARDLALQYPAAMPCLLYGTAETPRLEHLLVHGPNAQISACGVALDFGEATAVVRAGLGAGLVAVLTGVRERSSMPYTASNPPVRFEGANLEVPFAATVHRVVGGAGASGGRGWEACVGDVVAEGCITLGVRTHVDYNLLNVDPTSPDDAAGRLPHSIFNRFLDVENAHLWDDYQRRMAVRRDWRRALYKHIRPGSVEV